MCDRSVYSRRNKMTENRPYVPWKLMNDFMIDVFKAAICADVLLESDRRGIESHGCNRFKPIYIDRIVRGTLLPVTEVEILRETPTTVVMDAHNGMGMVASHQMMEMLIRKAKTCGMAGGAIRNSTHYGIAGYWAGMAPKRASRDHGNERAAFRSDLWRGEYDGDESIQFPHGRGILRVGRAASTSAAKSSITPGWGADPAGWGRAGRVTDDGLGGDPAGVGGRRGCSGTSGWRTR